MPEDHQDHPVEISVWTQIWQTIRPPEGTGPGLSRTQRNLIRGTLAFFLLLALGGAGYMYYSGAPDRAEVSYQQGMRLMAANNCEGAIPLFDKAISTWDQHAHAYLERGNCKRLLKQFDLALDDYEKATDIDPDLADAYTARGMIFLDKKDLEKANMEFSKSITTHPTSDAYFQRAQIEAKQNDHAGAIRDYDRAIAIDRAAPFIYDARALSKSALGDEEGAHADRQTSYDLLHKNR